MKSKNQVEGIDVKEDVIPVVSGADLGDYFRGLREKIGLSQSDVADTIGRDVISQQLISKLEKLGVRSGTRWSKISILLDFYSKRGAKSLFAMVYQNGQFITSVARVYPNDESQEKTRLKKKLEEFLNQLDG